MRLPTPEEGVTRVPQCGDEDYERCSECQASRYERHLPGCDELAAWNDPLSPATGHGCLGECVVWPMGSGSA